MKKKLLTVAVIIAVLALVVTGSLAYFTADDTATNVFTVGSVEIEIYENDQPTDTDVLDFGTLTPIVKVDNPAADDSYADKVVEVKNTGINDAYIRVHVAVPTALVPYLHLDINETGWTKQADSTATVERVDYTVYTYDFDTAVATDAFTNELLKGVYLDAYVDVEEDADGNLEFILRNEDGEKVASSGFVAHYKGTDGSYTSAKVNVLVAAQAIQADGFGSATDALDSGFGSNPWA